MEVVDGMFEGQSQRGSVRAINRSHPITPPSSCAALGRVVSELVGLLADSLTRDTMRRLRFVVHAATWLHGMLLHGQCCRSHTARTLSCLRGAIVVRCAQGWCQYRGPCR